MARVKIEDIIEKLDHEMKLALEDALDSVAPGAQIDRTDLFRAFLRAVDRKCSTWENVPDGLVEKRCRHCHKDT